MKSYKSKSLTGEYDVWKNELKEFHNEDGPAIEYISGSSAGYKAWLRNNNFHKEDGPARIWADGTCQYWLLGKEYETKELWFLALTLEQKENYIWQLS